MNKQEVEEIARNMRAIFLEGSINSGRAPTVLNTQKFGRLIAENLSIEISDHIVSDPEMAKHLRGLCLKKENGDAVVLISGENNPCWHRFVYIKEICHVYMREIRCGNPEELFDSIVCGDRANDLYDSECNAVAVATAIFLPEENKADILHLYNVEFAGLDDIEHKIATRYQIPEKYVNRRLREWGAVTGGEQGTPMAD